MLKIFLLKLTKFIYILILNSGNMNQENMFL
jgi:hypothetical protein